MQYSPLGRDVERDVIAMMGRRGVGLAVWRRLAGARNGLSEPVPRDAGRPARGAGAGRAGVGHGCRRWTGRSGGSPSAQANLDA